MSKNNKESGWKLVADNVDGYSWENFLDDCSSFKSKKKLKEECHPSKELKIKFYEYHHIVECVDVDSRSRCECKRTENSDEIEKCKKVKFILSPMLVKINYQKRKEEELFKND